jgi:hypothetical protein
LWYDYFIIYNRCAACYVRRASKETPLASTLLGLHLRNTHNVGDRFCHPLDYINTFQPGFTTKHRVYIADIKNPFKLQPDLIIVGGGALGFYTPQVQQRFPEATLVAWGVGCTNSNLQPVSQAQHDIAREGYALWGSRDVNTSNFLVPCVSCMHPDFELVQQSTHPVVVYGHAERQSLQAQAASHGYPYLDNLDKGGIAKVLRFLGSGETVITSSYHGAYWATLLGKKVAIIPFGAKFFSLPHQPPIVDTITAGVAEAVSFPLALQDCRSLNQQFFKHVMALTP